MKYLLYISTARFYLCVALIASALCAMVIAQKSSINSADTNQKKKHASPLLSPYDVKRLIDEESSESLESYWQQLGVKPSHFAKCEEMDNADLFAAELDGKRGNELLLRLHNDWTTRFIIYAQHRNEDESIEWRYVDLLDLEYQKYAPAEYRTQYEQNGSKEWLIISPRTVSGTGVSAHSDSWYEITAKGFNEVLTYPKEGYEDQNWTGTCMRKVSSEITRSAKIEGSGEVEVKMTIAFTCFAPQNYDVGDFEFSKEQPLFFSRINSKENFTLDEAKSKISKEELAAVFDIGSESLTPEIFLKYNLPELEKVAAQSNEGARNWLRSLLDKCGESSEKRQLQQLLSKNN